MYLDKVKKDLTRRGPTLGWSRKKMYSRAAALFMVTVLIAQMFTFLPGLSFDSGPVNEELRDDLLWMWPEIVYGDETIYNGMEIPVDAILNAKYEFTIKEDGFPVKVFLPDVLKPAAGIEELVDFIVNGKLYDEVEFLVTEEGEIDVVFDPSMLENEKVEDIAKLDGATCSGDCEPEEECCESNADITGSVELNDVILDNSLDGNDGKIVENEPENDENLTENGVGDLIENSPTSSNEPVENGTSGGVTEGEIEGEIETENFDSQIQESENSTTTFDPNPASDLVPFYTPVSIDFDPDTGSCNDDCEAHSSPSIFANVGSPTAGAHEGKLEDDGLFTITFMIPVEFDLDALNIKFPKPGPDLDALEAYYELLETLDEDDEVPEMDVEPWLVTIQNTVYDRGTGKYKSEDVVVELVYGFELIMPLDITINSYTAANYQAQGTTTFEGIVNWNDNQETPTKRPTIAGEGAARLLLTLYYYIPGLMDKPAELNADILTAWREGINTTEFPNPYPVTIIETPASPSAQSAQDWKYQYTGLPLELRTRDPQDTTKLTEAPAIKIEYSFMLRDDTGYTAPGRVSDNFIIEPLPAGVDAVGFMCTRKADFVITKEWKDGLGDAGTSRYGTRPIDEEDLLERLNLGRDGKLTSFGTLDSIKTVDIENSHNVTVSVDQTVKITNHEWIITVKGMPAFDHEGNPYYYFVTETDNSLPINSQHTLSGNVDGVGYIATYFNDHNVSDRTDQCYHNGRIVNRLTGDIVFSAWKYWLDDNNVANDRPAGGEFLLNRYPNITGRSYRQSTPVSGMEIPIQRTPVGNYYEIHFRGVTAGNPDGKFERFDLEGQEYIYYVLEHYSPRTEMGDYISRAKYPQYEGDGVIKPSWWTTDRNASNILFNGGRMENIKVGTANASVTKSWIAAAMQDKDMDVTVRVQHRLVANMATGVDRPIGDWKNVPKEFLDSPIKTDIDGEYTLVGFRAEIMTIPHSFSNLPKYDENGVLYEYRILESGIRVAPDPRINLTIGQPSALLDGYRIMLDKTPSGDNSNVTLTNRLVGQTEIRVRKIWNGGQDPKNPVLPPENPNTNQGWTGITFEITRNGEALTQTDIDKLTMEWENPGVTPNTSRSSVALNIPVEETWRNLNREENPVLITDPESMDYPGRWLIIKGLDRYDSQGREYEYRVTETNTSAHTNFYHTFGYAYGERPFPYVAGQERVGTLDATLINTPTIGIGRYIRVIKEWADDGDINCRGRVTFGLYHRDDGTQVMTDVGGVPTHVTTTVNRDNDWIGFLPIPAGEEYTKYYVREMSIRHTSNHSQEYPITYSGATLIPIGQTDYATTPIATVTTNTHHYNVFGRVTSTAGTEYRFKNVRRGDVHIQIEKEFIDGNFTHNSYAQRVGIVIEQRGNYGDWNTTTPVHTISTTLETGASRRNHIQGGGDSPKLVWDSKIDHPSGETLFPKYDSSGILIHYRIRETHIQPVNANGSAKGEIILITGGEYKINYDSIDEEKYHQYVTGIDYAAGYPIWGDHTTRTDFPTGVTPGAVPRPDILRYDVTNRRVEMRDPFTIHMLWFDVVRNTPISLPGPAGTNSEPLERRMRPDVYPMVMHSVGSATATPTPVNGNGFVPHFVSTRSSEGDELLNNTYFWTYHFDAVPRYDGAGNELFYTVRESMPNAGEYNAHALVPGSGTSYHNSDPTSPPIPADTWLSELSDVSTFHVLPAGTTDPLSPTHGVSDGGIIVNRRAEIRTMSGRKIWGNVPGGFPFGVGSYPSIQLEIRSDVANNHDGTLERVTHDSTNAPIRNASLTNASENIEFYRDDTGSVSATLRKYDEYGIFTRYRAHEVNKIPGYRDPEYNDFTLEVTNRFNTEGPTIIANVTKTWEITPFTSATIPDDVKATFILYRELTAANGTVIAGTKKKVGELVINYQAIPTAHAFNPTGPLFDRPANEAGRFLRIGYNGNPFHYTIEEVPISGYTRTNLTGTTDNKTVSWTHNIATDTYTIGDFTYNFTPINKYTGITDQGGGSYVRLHGTKTWDDNDNKFNTRPTKIGLNPIVKLKVFRAIENNISDTFQDITNLVSIVWTNEGDNDEPVWSYTVNGTAIIDPVIGPVGIAASPATSTDQYTLYQYSPTGTRYVYFVEEVAPINNQHYTIVGTNVTNTPTETFPIGTGSIRLQATVSGVEREVNFTNELVTTEATITKEWFKYVGEGEDAVAMTAQDLTTTPPTPGEFALMLPPSLEFKVQRRIGDNSWTDLFDRTGGLMKIALDKQQLLDGLNTVAPRNEMTVKFNIPLPMYNPAGTESQEYRLVETHIGGGVLASTPNTNFDNTLSGDEDGVGGFDVTYIDDNRVRNTVQTKPITIKKEWIDDNNRDNLRPAYVDFVVYRDNEVDGTLTSNQNMSVRLTTSGTGNTFTRTIYVPNLKQDGEKSRYIIEELHNQATQRNYFTLTSYNNPVIGPFVGAPAKQFVLGPAIENKPTAGTAANEYHFINSHNKITFDLQVTKSWVDATIDTTIGVEQRDNIRPGHIHLTLERSEDGTTWGTPIPAAGAGIDPLTGQQTATIRVDKPTGDGAWTAEWKDLIARHNVGTQHGVFYHFRVVETPCTAACGTNIPLREAYTPSASTPITWTSTTSTATGASAISDTSVVTNTLRPVSLAVEKLWQYEDGELVGDDNKFVKKEPVTVQVYFRLWSEAGNNTWNPALGSTATEILNSDNRFTHTFEGLPRTNNAGIPYEYTVREIKIGTQTVNPAATHPLTPFYSWRMHEVKENGARVGGPGSAIRDEQTATITNRLVTRGDIIVNIVWDDANNQDGVRPDTVTVRLIMDPELGTGARYQDLTLNQTENGWSGTFRNLPRYRTNGTEESTYYVVELDGSAVTTGTFYSNYRTPIYQVVTSGTTPGSLETNYNATTTGTAAEHEFTLERPISINVPPLTSTPSQVYEVYIRNIRVPTLMNIGVVKNWSDWDNTWLTRPTSIFLQLQVSTTGTGGWENVGARRELSTPWSSMIFWTDLPVSRNNGSMYNYGGDPPTTDSILIGGQAKGDPRQLFYRVVEYNSLEGGTPNVISGHDSGIVYTGSAPNDYLTNPPGTTGTTLTANPNNLATITNTRQTMTVTVTKQWSDGAVDGVGGVDIAANRAHYPFVRPTGGFPNVTIQLQYATNAAGPWTNVPPGNIPDGTSRELGTATPQNWQTTFTNLPRMDGTGQAYLYRVVETNVGGIAVVVPPANSPFSFNYHSTVTTASTATGDTRSITLTNNLEKRSDITVTKLWNDNSNQDGIRPGSVTIYLIRDRETTGQTIISVPVMLSSTNSWSHTFTNLPRWQENGTTESTYEIFEANTGLLSYLTPDFTVAGTGGSVVVGAPGTVTLPDSTVVDGWRSQAIPRESTNVEVKNSYTPKTMSVSVTKVWDDQENVYATRPANVQLTLEYRVGTSGSWFTVPTASPTAQFPGSVAINPIFITGPSTGPAAWTGLPIMSNNTGSPTVAGTSQVIYYRVVESEVTGYRTPVYLFTEVLSGSVLYGAGGDTRGFLELASNARTGTVTNTLDTVDVEVKKEWIDSDNHYRTRPSELTFTLERRLATPSTSTWGIATNSNGEIKYTMNVTVAEPHTYKFTGLPKVNASGTAWQYRVVETAAGAKQFSADSSRLTGTIDNPTGTHYKFSTVFDISTNITTITNELFLESIKITGKKTWDDNSNKYGARPDNLGLVVWYYNTNTVPNKWEEVPKGGYTISIPDKTGDIWDYSITGIGLAKYVMGSDTPIEYAVQEIIPDYYEVDIENRLTGSEVPENSSKGERVDPSSPNLDYNIRNANFKNKPSTQTTSLQVTKEIDGTPGNDTFSFEVYFSHSIITSANTGKRLESYTYDVFDLLGDPVDSDRTIGADGKIEIEADQYFVLNNLPQELYYKVVELDHPGYDLYSSVDDMTGKLNSDNTPKEVIVVNKPKPTGGGGSGGGGGSPAEPEKPRAPEISIINETPNEGLINGRPGRRTNAGGMVTVETPDSLNPDDWDSDTEVPGALAVLWKPNLDRFWSFSNEITVVWTDFDDDTEFEVTIENFINPDGSFKHLDEADISNPEFRKRFPNARLTSRDGAARLILCNDIDNMPATVTVYVQFLPSIAVRNVTENSVGGRVRVECSTRGGNLNNNADGVPALGGVPYVGTTKVYGVPDPGYRVDWDYIVIRNLNDLGGVIGEPVFVVPNADGTFTTQLQTIIAGQPEIVEKSGRIYEGSIVVELDGLPVPLQIDLRFVPIGTPGSGPPGSPPIISYNPPTGTLPQTGVESVINTLLIGLVTSMVATAAIAVVIWRLNAKEKRKVK